MDGESYQKWSQWTKFGFLRETLRENGVYSSVASRGVVLRRVDAARSQYDAVRRDTTQRNARRTSYCEISSTHNYPHWARKVISDNLYIASTSQYLPFGFPTDIALAIHASPHPCPAHCQGEEKQRRRQRTEEKTQV